MNKQLKYLIVFSLGFVLINYVGGKILLHGINQFYGLNQHSDILMIGHSHLMLSVDKQVLEDETGLKVSKYTREGVNVIDRYTMTKQYLESPYSDSLQYVLYGVDQFTFTGKGLSENSYKLFYPFMDEKIMNQYIKESEETTWDYYIHKLLPLTRYTDALINASQRGWRNDYSNFKIGNLDVAELKAQIATGKSHHNREIIVEEDLLKIFKETLEMITNRGIRVILVNTPVVDVLNDVDKDGYDSLIQLLREYAEGNSLIEYWDFNPQFSHDYSIFFDPIHLNPKGQQVITQELIKQLNE